MFERHGISFLTGNVLASEMGALSNVGRILSFQRPIDNASAVYANGMNFEWYGDEEGYDITDPTVVTEEQVWNLQKLYLDHSEVYGLDTRKGNRVFGMPVMAVNTSNVESTVSLQIGHTASTTVEHISSDVGNDLMTLRILGGNLGIISGRYGPSSLVGKQMKFAYYDLSLGTAPIPGLDSPATDLAVSGKLGEYLGTVQSVDTNQALPEIVVHLDEAYTEQNLQSIVYMAPDNQVVMILPLGTGTLSTTETPPVKELLTDSYRTLPSQESLTSWAYNQTEAAMSDALVCASPVISVTLQPNELIKFMAIAWRHASISEFRNGLTIGIL